MRSYYLQLARKGPAWSGEQTPALAALMAEHLAYVRQMTEAGHYAVAGPIWESDEFVGVAVVNAASQEEAEAISAAAPAARAGHYQMQLLKTMLPNLSPVLATYHNQER
jgi:uncharacterized protein YciI